MEDNEVDLDARPSSADSTAASIVVPSSVAVTITPMVLNDPLLMSYISACTPMTYSSPRLFS